MNRLLENIESYVFPKIKNSFMLLFVGYVIRVFVCLIKCLTYTNLKRFIKNLSYENVRGFIRILNYANIKDLVVFKLRGYFSRKFELGLCVSSPNYYDLTYFNGNRRYKIRFPKQRGPLNIVCVTTNLSLEEIDITSEILELLGPGHNFYGIPTSPNLLGYPNLMVMYVNDKKRMYIGDEIIKLKV